SRRRARSTLGRPSLSTAWRAAPGWRRGAWRAVILLIRGVTTHLRCGSERDRDHGAAGVPGGHPHGGRPDPLSGVLHRARATARGQHFADGLSGSPQAARARTVVPRRADRPGAAGAGGGEREPPAPA